MSNYFTDNKDLQFTLDNLELEEVAGLRENNYKQAKDFDFAPENYADAKDSYKRVLELVGEITGERIAPRARVVDEEGPHFANNKVTYHPLTVKNLEELRQAEVFGVMLPRRYGGLNFPVTIYTMMTEMVSRADASLQNLFGLQDIAETICEFGTEEQKQKYLPRFASGEADGSMDLTEPDSGSDLQSVRLKATLDPKTNQWYLDGMKRFITNGCAKVHLVLARSEEGTSDGRGLSMFICEACPELVVRRIEHKLGIHGVATAELQYNHVPAELCGQRKRGLIKYVMSLMNGARVGISAQALGIAEAAYREARKYAAERKQFKTAIEEFPPVFSMLASMKMEIIAARTLLYETTKMVDLRNAYNSIVEHGKTEEITPEDRQRDKLYSKIAAVLTPMSKAFATEMANRVCYQGIQIHGGTGYMKDFNAERFYRDARITNIYEGTTQLQHVAAIGGIVQRVLDPLMDELAGLTYHGKLKRLSTYVDEMRKKQQTAVQYVAEKKDSTYYDLVTKHLVEMETYVFVSYLMLRDALKDSERELLAERYILDAVPEFDRSYAVVMSGDVTLIDNYRELIDY
ncbi:MAG TPA: acyl-CoA dehydrogenase [Candidatus Riflebacteria bacterium]|jgi:alkylation response protein AidB-like acyl-CoA dehydrogenase|nr:acyl-CoA dehydrogenase [Candidatus Riflebacteria bacterium]